MSDTQQDMVYQMDAILWSHMTDKAHPVRQVLQPSVWRDYCQFLLDDAMRKPYRDQRRRAGGKVTLVVSGKPGTARVAPRIGRLVVHPDRMSPWVACHEVAHMVAWDAPSQPHYWRWVSVYAQMVGRHIDRESEANIYMLAAALGIQYQAPRRAVAA